MFYLAELFRHATFYLAEQFRHATFYLAEQFRYLITYIIGLKSFTFIDTCSPSPPTSTPTVDEEKQICVQFENCYIFYMGEAIWRNCSAK